MITPDWAGFYTAFGKHLIPNYFDLAAKPRAHQPEEQTRLARVQLAACAVVPMQVFCVSRTNTNRVQF